MTKKQHAKKRLDFYKGKVEYFQKQAETWEKKFQEAASEEVSAGQMDGQIEIIPNTSACGTESGD
jgi:hypothetical protein